MLRECEAVVPDTDRRILAMAEREAAHRLRMVFRGLFLGCSLCAMAAGGFAGALLLLAGVPLAVVAGMVLAAMALCALYARAKTRAMAARAGWNTLPGRAPRPPTRRKSRNESRPWREW